MFNDNKSNDGERIEEIREIGEDGNYKEDKNNNEGSKGKWRKGKGHSGGSGGSGGSGNNLKGFLLLIIIIGGLLVYALGADNVFNELKQGFTSSPGENINSMVNSMNQANRVNQKEGNLHPIYDDKQLFYPYEVLGMGYEMYLVYGYTESPMDNEMNEWVLEYDSKLPIYRTSLDMLKEVDDIESYVYDIHDRHTPAIIVVQGVTGVKNILNYFDDVYEADEGIQRYLDMINPPVEEENGENEESKKSKKGKNK